MTTVGDVLLEAQPGFACGKQDDEGVFQFRMNNLTRTGQLDLSRRRRVPADAHKKMSNFLLQSGDVLFNATNSPDGVGKSVLIPELDEPAVFSNHFLRLRPDPRRVCGGYLSHWLQWNFQRGVFEGMCRQWVNQATVSREGLLSMELPLPTLDDQRRIAAILDQGHALRAKRRQALATLNELTQSTFLEMFGDPTAPGSWPLETVAHIASDQKHAIVDGPFGSALKPSDYEDEGVPVIRIKNISRDGELVPRDLLFISPAKFDTLRRSSLQAGDVLVSRVGTLGNTCVFPSDFGDALLSTTGVCKVTTDRGLMLPEFLHAAIRTTSFQRQIENSASTSVQKYFNLSALRAWRIIVPPVEDQLDFVDRVGGLRAHRASLLSQLDVTESLQASLQHSAFASRL